MNRKNISFLIVMVLSWSAYFVLCKVDINRTGSPIVAGFFLRACTFLFLSLYSLPTKRLFKSRIPFKPMVLTILVGSLAFVFDLLINIGFQYSTVSIGTILLRTEIIFVCFFSILFNVQKFKIANILYIILMLIGVIFSTNVFSEELSLSLYDLLFILSALLNTVCAFTIKFIQNKYQIEIFSIIYINNIVALFLYLGGCILVHRQIFLANINGLAISFLLLPVIFGALSQTILMITYYRNLKELPVWIVKAFLLLVPVFSSLFEFAFLGTEMSGLLIIGMIFVIGGSLGITLSSKR